MANLVGEAEFLAVNDLSGFSALDGSAAHSLFSVPRILRGMELFTELFGRFLAFVYQFRMWLILDSPLTACRFGVVTSRSWARRALACRV